MRILPRRAHTGGAPPSPQIPMLDRAGLYRGRQALIVDEKALNAEVLGTLLASFGVAARILFSPQGLEEAIYNAERLDVLSLDLELPERDGFLVHRQIRTLPQIQDLRVGAYTVQTSQIAKARRERSDDFLAKPLLQERFGEQLGRILRREPVWDV